MSLPSTSFSRSNPLRSTRAWEPGSRFFIFAVLIASGCIGPGANLSQSQVRFRDGDEFIAPVPGAEGRRPEKGLYVRFLRTEIRGNPREGRREWVKAGTGLITQVSSSEMRIQLVDGVASPGDRVLCCDDGFTGAQVKQESKGPERVRFSRVKKTSPQNSPKPVRPTTGMIRDSV